MKVFLFILFIINIALIYGYGEPFFIDRPNFPEREALMATNAVRIDPKNYMLKYFPFKVAGNVMNTTIYPPVKPLYYNRYLLNLTAIHSLDMATHECFQHDGCDKVPIMTRVFDTLQRQCIRGFSENIGAGYGGGMEIINYLICEKPLRGNECYQDKVNDGHRANIMSNRSTNAAASRVMKTGSKYTYYWTQDFSINTCEPNNYPVPSGSHTFVSGKVKYFAAFYSEYTPTNPTIYINSKTLGLKSYAMTLDLGTINKGVYIYQPTSFESCQSYYFDFTVGTKHYRYPETGYLKTVPSYDDTSCTAWAANP